MILMRSQEWVIILGKYGVHLVSSAKIQKADGVPSFVNSRSRDLVDVQLENRRNHEGADFSWVW